MTISEVLDEIADTADGDRVSVEEVFEAFGRRAYGPLLFVIGLLSFSPVGAIPGASILFGSLVIVLMVQYVIKDSPPWVPDWILRQDTDSDRAAKAVEKIKPYMERVEKIVRPRMEQLSEPPWTYAVAVMAILMGACMFPLALVPWGVMAPSLVLAVFGLGMMSSDGLLIACALVGSVLSLALGVWLLSVSSII